MESRPYTAQDAARDKNEALLIKYGFPLGSKVRVYKIMVDSTGKPRHNHVRIGDVGIVARAHDGRMVAQFDLGPGFGGKCEVKFSRLEREVCLDIIESPDGRPVPYKRQLLANYDLAGSGSNGYEQQEETGVNKSHQNSQLPDGWEVQYPPSRTPDPDPNPYPDPNRK